jgi:hypothetical protein
MKYQVQECGCCPQGVVQPLSWVVIRISYGRKLMGRSALKKRLVNYSRRCEDMFR